MSVYVVQPGDSLGRIARRFETSTQAILGANPDIANPDLIRVGQRIQIPGVPPLPPVNGGVTPPATATAARQQLLAEAAKLRGIPYLMPPPFPFDGRFLDCSLFVITALHNAGIALPDGVRTAEQIRHACEPIADWNAVQPGDLLFFEGTYNAGKPWADDGRLATHVGFSEGAGTQTMWDCHESENRNDGMPGVGETTLSEVYWLPKMFEARRPPGLANFEPIVTNPGETVYRVTVAGVRMRATPSTSAEILVQDLGQGTRVTDLGTPPPEADGYRWLNIRTPSGQVGWAASQYLVPATAVVQDVEEPSQYVVTVAGVRLRTQPGTSQAVVVEDLGQGTHMTAVSTEQRSADDHVWLEARTDDGKVGWVAREFLRQVSTGAGGAATVPDFGLSGEANFQFSFQELWPCIQNAAGEYGTDAQVIAGIVQQESHFKNYIVHDDGTGHGLVGLDDGGLLADFERWSGLSCGRGAAAIAIPPAQQLEYCAKTIAEYARKYSGPYAASRAWHRGEPSRNDARGQQYEVLIRDHVRELFGH